MRIFSMFFHGVSDADANKSPNKLKGFGSQETSTVEGKQLVSCIFFPSIEWVTSMFLYKADFFSIRNWINIVAITKKKLISPSYMFVLTDFLPSSKTHRFWWGGAITFIGTYTHTWCYATARSSATATFIKQLSWFDFGPLEEEKTLRGLSMEKLNPRPLFFSQNWRFAMAKR